MTADKIPPTDIDVGTFWHVLGERPTGMTIVTTQTPEGPRGFLGLSAAHVSADPPMMLVSVDHKTSALEGILASGAFAINFLPATAGHVADAFTGKTGLKDASRFVEAEWATLVTGAPVFSAALGAFDCRVDEIIERRSISIVLGKVVGASSTGLGEPLIFFRGRTRSGFAGDIGAV